MSRFIVHMGYPKCASTFLQKKVLSKIDCNYFGGLEAESIEHSSFAAEPYKQVIKSQEDYDAEKDLTIISYPPISSPSKKYFTQEYFDQACENLIRLDKNVKVIIVLRNQIDLIKSWYVYSVTRGLNTITYKSFDQWLEDDFAVMNPEYLVTSCEKYFSQDNMLILPVELLNSKSTIFFSKLSNFIGKELPATEQKKVNRGYYNYYSINCWRLCNFMFVGVEHVLQKAGIDTRRGSVWHTFSKHGFLKFKGKINPKIQKYFPRGIDLEIDDAKLDKFSKLFKEGNRLANRYSAYPLEEFNYIL